MLKVVSFRGRISTLLAAAAIVGSCGTDPELTDPPVEEVDLMTIHIEGHRGARGLKPENTLPAFETALDLRVSTLELDLQLSADDQLVVWHDPVLGANKCRSADQADFPINGVPIASLTAAQLGDYVCDINPDPQRFPQQDSLPTTLAELRYQPITLDSLFEFVAAYAESDSKTAAQRAAASTVEFNIETKRDVDDPSTIGDGFDGVMPGRFEREVVAAVARAGTADRVVIQSFDHRSLWAIRSIDSNLRLAALTAGETPDFVDLAERGADIWSPNYRAINSGLIDQAHREGLDVIPWTVNDAEDMRRVMRAGADGLITDRPDIAVSLGGEEPN